MKTEGKEGPGSTFKRPLKGCAGLKSRLPLIPKPLCPARAASAPRGRPFLIFTKDLRGQQPRWGTGPIRREGGLPPGSPWGLPGVKAPSLVRMFASSRRQAEWGSHPQWQMRGLDDLRKRSVRGGAASKSGAMLHGRPGICTSPAQVATG